MIAVESLGIDRCLAQQPGLFAAHLLVRTIEVQHYQAAPILTARHSVGGGFGGAQMAADQKQQSD